MANIRVSPKFITAKTKEALQLAILRYQLVNGKSVTQINISPDPDGGWTAWFYDELDTSAMLNDFAKGGKR